MLWKRAAWGDVRFAGEGVVGGAVHQVDVEPAVFVVVKEGYSRARGFEDELFIGGAHGVMPGGQTGFGGDVLKDDGAGFYEAAGGDGAFFGVEDRGVGSTGVYATHGLGLFLSWGLRSEKRHGDEEYEELERTTKQVGHPLRG